MKGRQEGERKSEGERRRREGGREGEELGPELKYIYIIVRRIGWHGFRPLYLCKDYGLVGPRQDAACPMGSIQPARRSLVEHLF